MNTKHSSKQTRRGIQSAAKMTCLFMVLLVLCDLAASEALAQNSCQVAQRNCSACQADTSQGRSLIGVSINKEGKCVATGPYGCKPTDPCASDNLKICQRCLDDIAAAANRKVIGRVKSFTGDVSIRTPVADWADVRADQPLSDGDEIITSAESEAVVHMTDGSVIIIRPLTQIDIGALRPDDGRRSPIQILLRAGEIAAKVNPQEAARADFSVRTPTATASVRGTEFTIAYDPVTKVTTVVTTKGVVDVDPEGSATAVLVKEGEAVTVTAAGVKRVPFPSGDSASFGPMQYGQDIADAADYKALDLPEPRPELCEAECARDPRCKAYTYVRPGTYDYPRPRCWLKEKTGRFIPHVNAVSAIKKAGQQTQVDPVGGGGGGGMGGSTGVGLTGPIAIQTMNGNYLSAVQGGGIQGSGAINSDATSVRGWETFMLEPLSDGKYALKTMNGNYLTAMRGGGLQGADVIHTDGRRIDAWEKFTLERQPDGTYAIRTINGNYVTALNGGGIGGGRPAIHSNVTSIGRWEKFKLLSIGGTSVSVDYDAVRPTVSGVRESGQSAVGGGPNCTTLAGAWTQQLERGDQSTWHITAAGEATESGLGNAKGAARLSGRKLRIDWRTPNGYYSGYYEWELDSTCNSGAGVLVFTSGASGSQKSTVRK